MTFDLTVDHYVQDKEGGETRLVRTNPYLRIKMEGVDTPFFLRGGNVHSEDGKVMEKGDWPIEEMLKTSEQGLNAVGFSKEGGSITSITRRPKQKE